MVSPQPTPPPVRVAPGPAQERPPQQATALLRALAYPRRFAIVSLLRTAGELMVTEIYTRLELPQAIASQHLIALKNQGVLNVRKAGTARYYSLAPLPEAAARTLAHLSQLLTDLTHEAAPAAGRGPAAATGQAGAVILELYAQGTRRFGSVESFNRWLSKPNDGLGFAIPSQLLLKPDGPTLVLDELGRLEPGDPA